MIESFPVRLWEKGQLLVAKPTGRLDERGQWTYTVYRDDLYHGVYAEDVLLFVGGDEMETTKDPQTVYHSAGIPSLNKNQNKYTVISYRVFGDERETRYFYTKAGSANVAISNVIDGDEYRNWAEGSTYGSHYYPVIAVLLDWVEDAVVVER